MLWQVHVLVHRLFHAGAVDGDVHRALNVNVFSGHHTRTHTRFDELQKELLEQVVLEQQQWSTLVLFRERNDAIESGFYFPLTEKSHIL